MVVRKEVQLVHGALGEDLELGDHRGRRYVPVEVHAWTEGVERGWGVVSDVAAEDSAGEKVPHHLVHHGGRTGSSGQNSKVSPRPGVSWTPILLYEELLSNYQ